MRTKSPFAYVVVLAVVGVLGYRRAEGHPISVIWTGAIIAGSYIVCEALVQSVKWLRSDKK